MKVSYRVTMGLNKVICVEAHSWQEMVLNIY